MNYDRWKHLSNLGMAMDWRHVRMINAVLMNERPASVVEIGCYHGHSSAAIIEAKEAMPELAAELVDPNFHPPLREIAEPLGIRCLAIASAHYTGKPECWVIDGDHGVDGANIDYRNALQAKARIIIIHDATYIHEGARQIAQLLEQDATVSFADCGRRLNEATERGIVFGFFYHPNPATLEALQELAK